MSVSPYHSKASGNDAVHPATYVGSSDPASPDTSVTADNKLWIDTTTGTTFATGWLLKIRATSNTVWTTILDLAASLALKANLASPTFTGTPSVPDDPYDATGWNGNVNIPTKNAIRDKIETIVAASGVSSVFGRTGAVVAASADYTVAQVTNAAATTGTLAQFASTTSAQLATLLSDETGSGAAVFASAPTLSNPVVGTQSAGDNSTKGASTAYADNAVAKQPEVLIIAVSDETTAITTGTAKVTFRMPFAMTVTAVRASVNTVSSSGLPTVDINESGTTILSTKLTIDASEFTSTTAATPAVISDASLADDAEMTIDIDTAGTGAKGLKVVIIGTRT